MWLKEMEGVVEGVVEGAVRVVGTVGGVFVDEKGGWDGCGISAAGGDVFVGV